MYACAEGLSSERGKLCIVVAVSKFDIDIDGQMASVGTSRGRACLRPENPAATTHADKTRDAATRTRCTSMCTHHIRLLGTYNEQKADSLVLDVDRTTFMLYYAEKNDHRDVLNDRLPQHIA